MIIRLIIVIVIISLIETYLFIVFKSHYTSKIGRWAWIIGNNLPYLFFFYTSYSTKFAIQSPLWQMGFGLMLTFLVPKLLLLAILLGEDIFRVLQKAIRWICTSPQPIAGRKKFIFHLGLAMVAIPFSSFLYGIFRGKYNYKVLKYELAFEDLPQAFDGLRLTHISDIHSGSFTNASKIQYGIDLINEQQSDLILFTGDIVNNLATEMNDWIPLFKKLKAPLGKYATLGNHDYGHYTRWKDEQKKEANFKAIKAIHPKIGFDLLLNEHRIIEKNGAKIALVGVENWGHNFYKAGDLGKAGKGLSKEDFKILMSHDPSHWEYKVKEDPKNYQLTLSGHTHGFQMGIEIPGFIKWSPAKYMYKQWAGIYQHAGRIINVNRGFGYHAFPGRVGIWPEITVITLKKS